ncbi:MAG TPA: aminomethyl-transferring glycine dehydrogenase subunit GcvPB, partial [Mesotoga infera]|nr:aminomethyl-transferring glycine dehydrogenase subunit GcvPB [Mesotoga infera]
MTIFDATVEGRTGFRLPEEKSYGFEPIDVLPEHLLRDSRPELPQVSELQVVRHFMSLSKKNHSVDSGFYPLGSCTMKYNPKLNEEAASFEGFSQLHPYQPEETIQGALELMYNLQNSLCEITGMDAFTLQPAAGAHGELVGMLLVKKYFELKGDTSRKKVIVPDSAHGTNPASAAMAGYDIVEVASNKDGRVDLEILDRLLDESVAAIMLTNPNTVGLFEKDICEIQKMAHDRGALLYYDGANLNAIMGHARPGDMGFDIVHLNLHKTFSTPHGMGGPGSGTVGVKAFLKELLPVPVIDFDGQKYRVVYDLPDSIGKIRSFFGNFGVLVRAYAYIKTMGSDGLKRASEMAVLNANYLRSKLIELIPTAYPGICKHEFVLKGTKLISEYGIRTLDLAKRLLDYGIHPPTVYFPLIV